MSRLTKVLIVLFIAGLPFLAAAQGSDALEIGPIDYFTMSDSPFSGPVETQVFSSHPIAGRGTGTDVFMVVQNHSNDATVSVNLGLELEWSDGSFKRPFHLGQDRIHILGPNEGVGFVIFYAIPGDAPLGTTVFRAKALVGRVTGDDDDHRVNQNPMVAVDFAEFEVVN